MFNHDKANENANKVMDKAQDMTDQAKESGKDWVSYVVNHPVQSLMFGAVIGLALKGLLRR